MPSGAPVFPRPDRELGGTVRADILYEPSVIIERELGASGTRSRLDSIPSLSLRPGLSGLRTIADDVLAVWAHLDGPFAGGGEHAHVGLGDERSAVLAFGHTSLIQRRPHKYMLVIISHTSTRLSLASPTRHTLIDHVAASPYPGRRGFTDIQNPAGPNSPSADGAVVEQGITGGATNRAEPTLGGARMSIGYRPQVRRPRRDASGTRDGACKERFDTPLRAVPVHGFDVHPDAADVYQAQLSLQEAVPHRRMDSSDGHGELAT